MTGIYMIQNIINKKVYIGQSSDIKTRWIHHKTDLRNGTHHNNHLLNAWKRYGEENFKFIIIEECDINQLDSREIYWINYYDSYNLGYNNDLGGGGCRGYKHSEDELYKMREIQKPKHVIQCNRDGTFIKEWQSTSQISKTLKYSKRNIEKCLNESGHKSAYGFLWFYKNDYDSNNIDWNYYLNREQKYRTIGKKVIVNEIENNVQYVFESIKEAAEKLGVSRSSIYSCLNNKGNLSSKYFMCLSK